MTQEKSINTQVFEKLEANGIKNAKTIFLYLEKNKTESGIKGKSVADLFDYFNQIHSEGLVFDGKSITIGYRGIQYDYQALKNKMLIHYPESIIDIQLVYKGDKFSPKKEDGKIFYSHEIADPFNRAETNITGGYCVIKNSRGEFLTILSETDFKAHKAKAASKAIWNTWFAEMRLKTLFRKALSVHYKDKFEKILEEDNKNYDISEPKTEKVKNLQDAVDKFAEKKKQIAEAKDNPEDLEIAKKEYLGITGKKPEKGDTIASLKEKENNFIKQLEKQNETK